MTLGAGLAVLGIWLGYGISIYAMAKYSEPIATVLGMVFGGLFAFLATCALAG
jgi:hypothetical protein